MIKRVYILFTFLIITATSYAQHLQLVDNYGELGIMAGYNSYIGDVATDVQFLKLNYGAYYKKQFNEYVGIRINYEKINLEVSDGNSLNDYERARGFYFKRNFHEISVQSELYFQRFIVGRKRYRFSPYLGFGVGYLLSTPTDVAYNISSPVKNRIVTFPLNLGFKYNFHETFNFFGEFTHRFTTSDYVDHLPDNQLFNGYQANRSGKDQFFTAKLGISYTFLKIYGPDLPKKKNGNATFSNEDAGKSNPGKFSFLKRFKRN